MSQIKEQMLAAVSSPSKKMKRSSPTFQRARPVAVKQLQERYGNKKTADMLGISSSGLTTMIGRDDVSLTLEKLAELIILNGGQTLQRQQYHLIIARVPVKHADVVSTFLNALGIKSRDISE